jgi:hypothetical protein
MKIDRTKWSPITIAELKEMSDEEKSKLLSYAWDEHGEPRCWTIGIRDVKIFNLRNSPAYGKNVVDVSWSDDDGDPTLHGYSLDQPIDRLSGDEDYTFALYKRI